MTRSTSSTTAQQRDCSELARRLGLTLHRARTERRGVNACGGLQVRARDGRVIAGEEYDLSIGEVERFLLRLALEPERRAARLSP